MTLSGFITGPGSEVSASDGGEEDAFRDQRDREVDGGQVEAAGHGDLEGLPGPRQAHGDGQAHGLPRQEHLGQDQGE